MYLIFRPLMPPALLASAIAILWPIDAATPSSAGGPVSGSTSPIRISVSVRPGSAAKALPPVRYAPASKSDAVARYLIIVFLHGCRGMRLGLLVLVLSVAERPGYPEAPDVMPRANQAAWLKTKKQNDDDAVEHAFQLLRSGREQCVHLCAE